MPLPKCKMCGEEIKPDEECIKFKQGSVHTRCFNVSIKAIKEDKKEKKVVSEEEKEKKKREKINKKLEEKIAKGEATITVPVSEEEHQKKQEVYNYIQFLTKRKPSVKDRKLVEDYKKKFSISYDGILDALYYYYGVKENEVGEDCMGIVPYVYEEAREFMDNQREVDRKNGAITQEEFNNYYPVTVVVRKKTDRGRKKKIIDIGSIHV